MHMPLLEGKKGVVLGVANKRSIAWAIARAASDAGATLAFTYQGDKLKEKVEDLVKALPRPSPLYPCDVTSDDDIAQVGEALRRDLGTLDFLVHSLAFADRQDLEGTFLETSRKGYHLAQDVSSFSLTALSRMAAPLMTDGGSIITLTYLGSERAVKNYNVMGVAKAALEASVRYLAADLGRRKIRVNAVSAGPVNTLAARGISGFTEILDFVAERSPLGRNVEIEEVANTALFLLSPLSSGITGEVIHVDCGYHIVGI
ncbi:MAG TPA: enoyl-ACP reductase [Planctomycetota bacterium]|nr:enoyl-ACP reductase [Planctomycetota bacterium]